MKILFTGSTLRPEVTADVLCTVGACANDYKALRSILPRNFSGQFHRPQRLNIRRIARYDADLRKREICVYQVFHMRPFPVIRTLHTRHINNAN